MPNCDEALSHQGKNIEKDTTAGQTGIFIDNMEIDPYDLPIKARGPISPQNEADDNDSLPDSPSALRFEYRGGNLQVDEADPISQGVSSSNTTNNTKQASKTDEAEACDEKENTVDVEINSITSSGISTRDSIPQLMTPLGLQDLPEEILTMILSHVFPVADTLRPWYSCGMSTLGGRGFALNDEGITFNENLDVAFLRVNKACYEVGTRILYGSNHFRFQARSDACVWWFRRIGDHNIKKLRMLTFILNSGWRFDRRDPEIPPSPFEQCHEREWFTAVSKVQDLKVKLNHLSVVLVFWTDMRDEPDYCIEDKEELTKYRKMLIDRLAKFRDVKKAKIASVGPRWISEWEARNLSLLMQQPGSTLVEEAPKKKLTLKQVISYIKAEKWVIQQRLYEAIEEAKQAE